MVLIGVCVVTSTGSHCCLVLLDSGCQVTIFDDLSNTSEDVYERMKVLAGNKAHMMRFIKVSFFPSGRRFPGTCWRPFASSTPAAA